PDGEYSAGERASDEPVAGHDGEVGEGAALINALRVKHAGDEAEPWDQADKSAVEEIVRVRPDNDVVEDKGQQNVSDEGGDHAVDDAFGLLSHGTANHNGPGPGEEHGREPE